MSYKRSRNAYEADLQTRESPYVAYGTPLPPLDSEIRDDGSFVPVWQQEVRDERGRKRLHGAFTGGFSAGYFNTVGSKEGWTPSTFVSSRSDRRKDDQKASQSRPEDFMDDEDLAEAAEAQKIQTAKGYTGLGSTGEDEKRKGFLMDVFKAEGATMGVKLLQKMGWREGQGIGPRVRRKARDEMITDEASETHFFAPDNVRMIQFVKKDDRKGLGFAGEARLNIRSLPKPSSDNEGEDEDHHPSAFSGTTKKPTKPSSQPKRSGFGVGVLNDVEDDDEDPYEMGPKISYNKVIGGDKKSKKKTSNNTVKAKVTMANPLLSAKPVLLSKKSKPGIKKCRDGRLPLDGFVLADTIDASTTEDEQKRYPIPQIPEDWTSAKSPSASVVDPSRYQTTAEAAKASTLDPKARAAILGETQLPGKSVFDFLSPATRDRISSATGRQDLPLARNETHPSLTTSREHPTPDSQIPDLDKDIALAALGRGIGGWMPYAEDLPKRERYRAFLSYRAGVSETLPPKSTSTPNTSWLQELGEFAHAARVFKPMTGMMASRFTTSSSTPTSTSGDPKDSKTPILSTADTRQVKLADPAEEAARLGMFGPMTRSEGEFWPTRLVCKRFNVKPPAHVQPDGDGAATSTPRPRDHEHQAGSSSSTHQVSELVSKEAMGQMMREAAMSMDGGRAQEKSGGDTAVGGSDAQTQGQLAITHTGQAAEIDASRNDALEGQRAGDAVFKAIFGSDDDDSD